MWHVTFYYWHWHKIQSHQFSNPFLGTLARSFHFRQWLRACAVTIGASYFGDLFSPCQQVLGHASHIWYSLGLKSLAHSHSTHAGPARIHCVMTGMFDRKWKGRASVLKHLDFLNGLCKFRSLIKTHNSFICNIINIIPYNGCSQMLRISLKT